MRHFLLLQILALLLNFSRGVPVADIGNSALESRGDPVVDVEEGGMRRPGSELNLTIIHINDIHAYFEATNANSLRCRDPDPKNCYGGVARVYTKQKQIRQEDPEALFLNAGDFYQGTVWYSKFKYVPMVEFGSWLNYTAMGLGNHDFDDSIDGLRPFAENTDFPLLASNINDTKGLMAGLYNRSVVINVKGVQVGIIGYITQITEYNFPLGNVVFTDEVESVRKEAERLKGAGVQVIIALGHSGYEIDIELAENIPELDVVVGGHSHTFLYTPADETDIPPDTPEGEYPTYIVNTVNGKNKTIPVVQAKCYTKYLGHLQLQFDTDGELKIPVEGAGVVHAKPILLDGSVDEDVDTLSMMEKYKANLTEYKATYGRAVTNLTEEVSDSVESSIGNAVTDSMALLYDDNDTRIAFINNGGIRNSLEMGNITGEDIFYVLPFENTVDKLTITGKGLRTVLERAASKLDPNNPLKYPGLGLQLAGLRVEFEVTSSNSGNRVKTLLTQQSTGEFSPVVDDTVYNVAVGSFMAPNGAKKYSRGIFDDIADVTHTPGNITDFEAMKRWVEHKGDVNSTVEGRFSVTYIADTSGAGCGSPTLLPLLLASQMVYLAQL